jgi:hypothetical protein
MLGLHLQLWPQHRYVLLTALITLVLIFNAFAQPNNRNEQQQGHSLSSAEVAMATQLGVHPKARPKHCQLRQNRQTS